MLKSFQTFRYVSLFLINILSFLFCEQFDSIGKYLYYLFQFYCKKVFFIKPLSSLYEIFLNCQKTQNNLTTFGEKINKNSKSRKKMKPNNTYFENNIHLKVFFIFQSYFILIYSICLLFKPKASQMLSV